VITLALPEADEIDSTTPLTAVVYAAQSGSQEAFGELALRYHRLVYGAALRRLRDPSEAEELAQDVFVQMLRKIGQLRDPLSIAGWLRSITARLAANRAMRKPRLATLGDGVLEQISRSDSTPSDRALAGERADQVRAGLKRLRALDRQTLTAFYVEGRSLAEMSDRFASPLGTIKRRLHVARKRLARELATIEA
jgi:RNA polymerase sigma-70 factor (ECF subfamily)